MSENNKLELVEYIKKFKKKYKDRIFIPVHHYQGEDIIQFADALGDSYKLAVASSETKAEFIIFCGVMFMAEGASILAKAGQKVILPDLSAGCPMAEMAERSLVEKIYDKISLETGKALAPVLYINSYADLKDFCGRKNGSVCTSSNAELVIRHFLNEGRPILFLPDYYLGANTAVKMDIGKQEIAKINKDLSIEAQADIKDIKFFLWNGYCPIHQRFSPDQINYLRTKFPKIKIIVHPESPEETVKASDMTGSTEKIYNLVKDSPAGSYWGVGTETTFVARLAAENKDKFIFPLIASPCKNMMKTTLEKLYETVRSIEDFILGKTDKIKNEVKVAFEYKENANKALTKMIEIVNKG